MMYLSIEPRRHNDTAEHNVLVTAECFLPLPNLRETSRHEAVRRFEISFTLSWRQAGLTFKVSRSVFSVSWPYDLKLTTYNS